jgi:DNA primase
MEILELAKQDQLNPKRVSSTNGGEYHSPCPSCGGEDRFIIWDVENRYYCRRCEKSGDTIQYLREFHGLSFKDACIKANIVPKFSLQARAKKPPEFKPKKDNTPNSKWQLKGAELINSCHTDLLNTPNAISLLQKRGITIDSIKKYQLGWNSESKWPDWNIDDSGKKIWIPKGIVIPSFIDGKPVKIKIRRSDWHAYDKFPKYVEIRGSIPGPVAYGNINDSPILILESELDAILVQQEARNQCICIALGGSSKKPNEYIHSLLIKCPLILFSLDFDDAGITAFKWWKNRYKNLFLWVTPFEKSLGDAYLKGLDIKSWISLGINKYSTLTRN